MKFKEIKQYFGDVKSCPICGCELQIIWYLNSNIYECKNRCFMSVIFNTRIEIDLFKETIIFFSNEIDDNFNEDLNSDKEFKRYYKTLEYWKENDRYLAEILTR